MKIPLLNSMKKNLDDLMKEVLFLNDPQAHLTSEPISSSEDGYGPFPSWAYWAG